VFEYTLSNNAIVTGIKIAIISQYRISLSFRAPERDGELLRKNKLSILFCTLVNNAI
jgi:hypothetical protein